MNTIRHTYYNRFSGCCYRLDPEQFKERAEENVDARAEYIRAGKVRFPFAVSFRHSVKEPYRFFKDRLEFSRYGLKARERENAYCKRGGKQDGGDNICRYQRRVDRKPEQRNAVYFVQDAVLHRLAYAFVFAVRQPDNDN